MTTPLTVKTKNDRLVTNAHQRVNSRGKTTMQKFFRIWPFFFVIITYKSGFQSENKRLNVIQHCDILQHEEFQMERYP